MFILKTTNFIKNRFFNYFILNFSIRCKYIREIGILREDNNLSIIHLNIKAANQIDFDNEWKNFINQQIYKIDYLKLIKEGYEIQFSFSNRAFTQKMIKDFTHYYFIPKQAKGRYLFKYCSFNKNTITNLVNNTLWFSEPRSFNDPFDCRYTIDTDAIDSEVRDFYLKKFLLKNPTLTEKNFLYDQPTKSVFLQDLESHHFSNSMNKHGICCFSEKYNNRLMWAHYSDNARGICLIFDSLIIPKDDYYKFSKSKVKYIDGLTKKFYDGSSYFEVTDILYTKNIMWKYEDEIREGILFEESNPNRAIPYDPRTLVGIILGAKMSENDKKRVKSLINQLTKYKIEIIESCIDLTKNQIKLENNNLLL